MERVDIASVGKQIFERETDPELFPEDDEKIIDEIVERRVDDFLRNKRLGPMERLRLRAILEAEARKDLEPDGRAGV